MTDMPMQDSYTLYPSPRTTKLPNKSKLKKAHIKTESVTCDWVFCGKEFPNTEELRHHIDIIHTVKGQSYANPSQNHLSIPTPSATESSFAVCNSQSVPEWNTTTTTECTQQHVKCEPKTQVPKLYYCHMDDCKKGFRKSWHLKAHIRSHTGERPFACQWPLCEKRFTRSDKLYRHMNVHTKGKHFSCPVCTKIFVRNDNLTQHLKTHTLASTSTSLSQFESSDVM